MYTYQRWHHSYGGVGEFGVLRVHKEFIVLVEGGIGKKEGISDMG